MRGKQSLNNLKRLLKKYKLVVDEWTLPFSFSEGLKLMHWYVAKDKATYCSLVLLPFDMFEINIWQTLHKKWSFPLRISSVNVTRSAGNGGFGHIYWRNP